MKKEAILQQENNQSHASQVEAENHSKEENNAGREGILEADNRSVEASVLGWIENHIPLLLLLAFTVVGLLVRLQGIDYESNDYRNFLIPWYNEIKQRGGFAALGELVGDYNIPYQVMIAVFTYWDVEPLYLFKALSIIFDYVLAVAAGLLIRAFTEKKSVYAFLAPYGAVLLTPTVIMNSGIWAQCDVIYSAFVLLSIYFLYREKYIPAFVMLSVGMAFKLQAIFILPFYIYQYFREKKFSILHFVIIPAGNLLLGLPSLIIGLPWSDFWGIYPSQADTYPYMYMNYPSFWMMVGDGYDTMKNVAIWITIGILGSGLAVVLSRKTDLRKAGNFLAYAIWTVWTCLEFLPGMHERYGFILEMLLLVRIFWLYFSQKADGEKNSAASPAWTDRKNMIIAVFSFAFVEAVISACYGKCLFGNYMDHPFMAVGFFLCYIICTCQTFCRPAQEK